MFVYQRYFRNAFIKVRGNNSTRPFLTKPPILVILLLEDSIVLFFPLIRTCILSFYVTKVVQLSTLELLKMDLRISTLNRSIEIDGNHSRIIRRRLNMNLQKLRNFDTLLTTKPYRSPPIAVAPKHRCLGFSRLIAYTVPQKIERLLLVTLYIKKQYRYEFSIFNRAGYK